LSLTPLLTWATLMFLFFLVAHRYQVPFSVFSFLFRL
jgi:hypothetical protein